MTLPRFVIFMTHIDDSSMPRHDKAMLLAPARSSHPFLLGIPDLNRLRGYVVKGISMQGSISGDMSGVKWQWLAAVLSGRT